MPASSICSKVARSCALKPNGVLLMDCLMCRAFLFWCNGRVLWTSLYLDRWWQIHQQTRSGLTALTPPVKCFLASSNILWRWAGSSFSVVEASVNDESEVDDESECPRAPKSTGSMATPDPKVFSDLLDNFRLTSIAQQVSVIFPHLKPWWALGDKTPHPPLVTLLCYLLPL